MTRHLGFFYPWPAARVFATKAVGRLGGLPRIVGGGCLKLTDAVTMNWIFSRHHGRWRRGPLIHLASQLLFRSI